jgi:hypothetical protein
MAPTFNERQGLAKQFADDVARMRRCLQDVDRQVVDDDLVIAWSDYSDGLCAVWLMLPEADDALLAILLRHLPLSGRRWETTLLDAGDGSGDAILTLPEELLAYVGWKVGDTLSLLHDESGRIILRREE